MCEKFIFVPLCAHKTGRPIAALILIMKQGIHSVDNLIQIDIDVLLFIVTEVSQLHKE